MLPGSVLVWRNQLVNEPSRKVASQPGWPHTVTQAYCAAAPPKILWWLIGNANESAGCQSCRDEIMLYSAPLTDWLADWLTDLLLC